jgi:hypothetical protein
MFLGGLLAGVVLIILGFATWAIYLERLWSPAMEALGRPVNISTGGYAEAAFAFEGDFQKKAGADCRAAAGGRALLSHEEWNKRWLALFS